MFSQLSRHPLVQLRWHIKLPITGDGWCSGSMMSSRTWVFFFLSNLVSHLEYQLYLYVISKMTAVILGITVKHKTSRKRRENPPEDLPSLRSSLSHTCHSEPITGKENPREELLQHPLRVQEREDKCTKSWFCVEGKWGKLQLDRKFIVISVLSKIPSHTKNP